MLKVDITTIIVRWIGNKRQGIEATLGPSWLGALDSAFTSLGFTVCIALVLTPISTGEPSPELLWRLAEIGGALFIAFSVGLVGLGHRIGTPSHRNWLASICTAGGLSLASIATMIALATSREAGHSTWFDLWGLYWSIANLTLIGLLIASLPVVAASWREPESDED